jgi:hypothetical protein
LPAWLRSTDTPDSHLEAVQQRAAAFDAAVEHDDVAEKVHHEAVRRMLEHICRRADLLDVAVIHHHDAIRDLERFLLIVGDEDAGDVDLVVQAAQPGAARCAPWHRARRTARRAQDFRRRRQGASRARCRWPPSCEDAWCRGSRAESGAAAR